MRRLVLLTLVSLLAHPRSVAQEPASLQPTMQRFTDAVTAIEQALAKRDRAALAQPVATILEAAKSLPASATAAAAAARITTAATNLLTPVGDGAASDAFDFAQLRAACTACHLHTRNGNPERGLFPNRNGAAFGIVRRQQRDGTPVPDASGVAVFVEGVESKPTPMPRMPYIRQKGRRFDPALLAVTTGTTVEFPNDDVVFHNVFSLSRGNTFDLGSYGKGTSKQRTFDTPGLVKVHCNIHADMAAHVLVLQTPWHAVTAADGSWSIADLPDGEFTLRVWHPLIEEQRHRLVIVAGKATTLPLVVQETKDRVQHTDKHGRSYPE